MSEKTAENSERLGRQECLGIEPGTSYLSALRAEPLGHWWGSHKFVKESTKIKNVLFENKGVAILFR